MTKATIIRFPPSCNWQRDPPKRDSLGVWIVFVLMAVGLGAMFMVGALR